MILDYSSTAYQIEGVPLNKKCIERFSDLMTQAHIFDADDAPDGIDNDKVLRYLIYMFSPGTPLITAIPDIDNRKRYVLGKLELNDQSAYASMCDMTEPWIIERFIAFTRLLQSEDYSIMASAEVMMSKISKELLAVESSKAGDYGKYREDLEKWRLTLVQARERILKEESSIRAQRAVTFSVKAQNMGISPEEVARVFREKKEVFAHVIP